MDLQEFIQQVKDQEQYNVSIDFDGVIHQHFGVGDGTVSGDIIAGAKEALAKLSEKYRLIIFTAKAKPDRPLVNGKTGTELVWEWLEKHDIAKYIDHITCEKPRAVCYIDDKAIRFESWDQTMGLIDTLHPDTNTISG